METKKSSSKIGKSTLPRPALNWDFTSPYYWDSKFPDEYRPNDWE
jgi:hypothetical protein